MPLNTTAVGAAFWNKKTARGSSVHATATRLYSYSTVILQRLPNGHTIGNITRYSQTTSKHQSQVGVRRATHLVDGVPRGTEDLRPYLKSQKKKKDRR